MKARRLIALGLVAAAGLWIASGYFFPHQAAQGRPALRPGDATKLFRVAVIRTSVVPHSRKLSLSGRTEADKSVVITANST